MVAMLLGATHPTLELSVLKAKPEPVSFGSIRKVLVLVKHRIPAAIFARPVISPPDGSGKKKSLLKKVPNRPGTENRTAPGFPISFAIKSLPKAAVHSLNSGTAMGS
tara:strand:- start:113 stop:433 length:321 start_codon:yes stop_codon:yes gene_type:complete